MVLPDLLHIIRPSGVPARQLQDAEIAAIVENMSFLQVFKEESKRTQRQTDQTRNRTTKSEKLAIGNLKLLNNVRPNWFSSQYKY